MNLLDMGLNGIEQYMSELGEAKYRAKQIYKWLISGTPVCDMTNLPMSLKEKLKSKGEGYLTILKEQRAEDGTKKYLFRLTDGHSIESVVMKRRYGNTLCVSTQVGCRMGCAFCASCKNGRIRNLTSGEILAQYIAANKDMGEKRGITNIVLMGMGEPFDNYDEVVDFLRRINDSSGPCVSYRDISLSTCGLVPEILRFSKEKIPVTLCISLHSPFDNKRQMILPIAKKWKIQEILSAAKIYFKNTGRRIIIEYAVIDGFNNTTEDARELKHILSSINCHINLIPLNENAGSRFKSPAKSKVYAFAGELKRLGLSVTVRLSSGAEILGACGQLKNTNAESFML